MESTPAPKLEHASISSVLTPPDDDDAIRQIDEFLHQSGPQHDSSGGSEERPDPRRILLYEDGESDYIIPKIKKRLGRFSGDVSPSSYIPRSPKEADDEGATRFWQFPSSSSSSAYNPCVPTQDEVRESDSPKGIDRAELELFFSTRERFLPQTQ